MAYDEKDQFWEELRGSFIEQPRHERSLEQAAALARAPAGRRRARQPPVPSQYGKSASFSAAGTQGLIQISVPMECAKAWVVTLSTPSFLQIAGGGGSIQNTITQERAFARLRWGMGGANHTAEVDWSRGRSFIVCGSFVQVDAVAEFLAPPSLGLAPLILSASVTPFYGQGFPAGVWPQRSVYLGTIQNNSTSATFLVPAFGAELQLIFNGDPAIEFDVIFQREQGVVNISRWPYTGSSERSRPNRQSWMAVPGEAATFTVANTSAGPLTMTEVAAIYKLALA